MPGPPSLPRHDPQAPVVRCPDAVAQQTLGEPCRRPKKFGVLRQDQFAFDAFRVIDTVIMGNAPLWKALEERDVLYAKPHDQLTDEDGMRLGELEGIVGEEGGYTADADYNASRNILNSGCPQQNMVAGNTKMNLKADIDDVNICI